MNSLVFQKAGEADLDITLGIYNYYITTTTATFDDSAISAEVFRQRIFANPEKYPAYLIFSSGEIAGFCFLSQFRPKKAYNRTADLGMYLKPEFIGKGIGKEATAFLEKIACSKQIKVLVASISSENTASLKMIQKMGYEKCACYRQVGEKFGRLLDVVDFQKVLES